MTRWVAVGITIVLSMWTALQAVELALPGQLGLSPRAVLWLGILAAGLGSAQGFLPRVTARPRAEHDG